MISPASEPSTTATHFASDRYLYESRWASYWHQIAAVLENYRSGRVLEIGVGNGAVGFLLRKRCQLTTLDVDPGLSPDVVGDVREVDRLLSEQQFEVVLCAEVLEHLPFSDFLPTLRKLHRVTRETLVLTLPHAGPSLAVSLKLPLLPQLSWAGKIPWPAPHRPGGVHCWEIGKRGYSLRRIRRTISDAGFLLTRTYVIPTSTYHRVLILKKPGS